jgi:hypothetical protein
MKFERSDSWWDGPTSAKLSGLMTLLCYNARGCKGRSNDVMKARLLIPHAALLTLFLFTSISAYSQIVVTFDDLNETGSGSFLANGYSGLNWSNISCNNAILETGILAHIGGSPITSNGLTGSYYGMVSPSNVAGLAISEIESPGSNFNFLSAYLTGFLNSNLNIEVQGFSGTTLLYDKTVVAGATNPTLFTFNFLNINRLDFDAFGGQPAFGLENSSSGAFAMDNFTFEFVPEPSSLLLAALGGVSLFAFLKRKGE